MRSRWDQHHRGYNSNGSLALCSQSADCCLPAEWREGLSGCRTPPHNPNPPSLDTWADTRDGASLSTERDAEPSHGRRAFFFNLFCRSVEVSDGRAAGNVALRVDEAVMRGIKLHGRGKLVPGRRIETPDAASERHPSRSVLDLLLLLLVLSFR